MDPPETPSIQFASVKHILDAFPDGVLMMAANGTIEFANRSANEFFGYSDDELVGQMVEVLVPQRFRHDHVAKRAAFVKNPVERKMGRGNKLNLSAVTKDGREIPVDISLGAMTMDGKVVITTALRDLTDRIHVEDLLKDAREEADRANQAKSIFLANMSHEIRTPLNAISGFSEFLSNTINEHERTAYIETIQRNARHLAALIDDILDLSKVESGRVEVEVTNFPLGTELASVASSVQTLALKKSIEFSITLETPIPEVVSTDPTRLRQILINIVGNAVKFTDRGHVDLAIRFLPGDNDDARRLVFTVTDTGVGIALSDQTKLFQPFSQALSSTGKNRGGTGLGLVLSRKLARMLGGDISLKHSRPDDGSVFEIIVEVSVPVGTRVLNELYEAPSQRHPRRTPTRLKSTRVLVVEDAPDNQLLVSTILRAAGADVHVADDGKKGVEAAQGLPFDVVLMDIQLPVCDGYQATSTLRSLGYKGSIVALTAHATPDERERCLRSGCNDYRSKPLSADALVDVVDKWAKRTRRGEATL